MLFWDITGSEEVKEMGIVLHQFFIVPWKA